MKGSKTCQVYNNLSYSFSYLYDEIRWEKMPRKALGANAILWLHAWL